MESASSRMNFFVNPSLRQQIEYFKVQVKYQHMQKLYEAFDAIKNEVIQLKSEIKDVQEQTEIFGSVYQARNYFTVIYSNFLKVYWFQFY